MPEVNVLFNRRDSRPSMGLPYHDWNGIVFRRMTNDSSNNVYSCAEETFFHVLIYK